jgi:GNAT superfamily N-acetyltransferase
MTLGIGLASTTFPLAGSIVGGLTRRATTADLDGLVAMHDRCSADSLYQRYLTGGRGPGPKILARLLDPAFGQTHVVLSGASIVASGNLARDGDSVEAALLVEDAWQRRGVGTALFALLLREAAAAGYSSVLLHTHASNLGIQRMIRRAAERGVGPALWPAHYDGPLITYLLALST